MSPADLPEDRRAALAAVLRPGERVRWIGLPDPSRSPSHSGVSFNLAYVWLGITGLWQAGALTVAIASGLTVAWYYVGIGSIFLAIGGLFYLRAIRESRDARRVFHVITDQRLLTIDLAHPANSIEIAPDAIGYAEPETRPGGAGDIEIGHGAAGITAREATAFHHLRGVEDVNGAIKALRLIVGDAGRSLATEAPED
ncbi:MAG: hypothetical protein Q8S29_14435 [Phreatobacter sp.]|nr:hypothetical protein [Phreatobacter sp.]